MQGKSTLPERFWAKVEFTAGCWRWTAAKNDQGYGQIRLPDKGRKLVYAHRWAFEFCVGAIPQGKVIDHLCRNRACVNPDHMDVVTNAVNVLRGVGPAAKYAQATHCVNGHPFNGRNTYLPARGGRTCRECHRLRTRRYRAR